MNPFCLDQTEARGHGSDNDSKHPQAMLPHPHGCPMPLNWYRRELAPFAPPPPSPTATTTNKNSAIPPGPTNHHLTTLGEI